MFEFERLTNSCRMTCYELYVGGTSVTRVPYHLKVVSDCGTYEADSTICLH